MKLEVFAYYPNAEEKLTATGLTLLGTIHVFIDDYCMDIRGILCLRLKNGKYKCYLPSRKVINEEGVEVRMPYVAFTDKSVLQAILQACRDYLRKHYASAPKIEVKEV